MKGKNIISYPLDKIKILFLENLNESASQIFITNGYTSIRSVSNALSEDELIKEIKNVHILGIRSKTKISERVLQNAEKLLAIGCYCIGTNQVDVKSATEKGIAVFNAPYSNTRSVAELVIGSSIMLIRKIFEKNKAAHEGKWLKDAKGSHELRGKTIGIIGYGNIGSQVSVIAEAIGMKVIFYDTEVKLPLGNAVAAKTMKEVLKQSDIITFHVPQLSSTKNLINKENISSVKKGAILINYARGEVVDLNCLRHALVNNIVSGAAIDVYPEEPEKCGDNFSCILQGLNNVCLTPHIGGSTEEAQQNIGNDVSLKMFNFLEKGISLGSLSVPALALPPIENTHRILHVHNNVPGVLSRLNTVLSKNKINIVGQYLKTNDLIGYVVLDVDKNLSKAAETLLKKEKDTIKVRMLY